MEQARSQNLINYKVSSGAQSGTKLFTMCAWLYFIAFFLLPDDCGFYLGALFSAKRIMLFICWAIVLFNKRCLNELFNCIKKVKVLNILVALHMGVRIFVAIYRKSFNSFTIEFIVAVLVVYMFYFILHKYISVEKFLKFIEIVLYIICIAGFLEFFVGFNVFSLFATLGNRTSPIRAGFTRIYGNTHHPILLGVYVTILFFLTCMDYKERNLYLFRRPWLFGLSVVTVFMSGSRAPIGIFLASIILCVLLSKKNEMIKSILILIVITLIFATVVVLTIKTEFGRYIMRMITSAIDGIFGTTLSYAYGGEAFAASTAYRDALNKVFKLKYFSPLIGRGFDLSFSVVIDGVWLHSCDSGYVMTYVQWAYPGLIILIGFFALIIIIGLIGMFKYKNRAFAGFIIITIGYMCNIDTVAFMGSFMYMWMIMALTFIFINKEKQTKEIENEQSNN